LHRHSPWLPVVGKLLRLDLLQWVPSLALNKIIIISAVVEAIVRLPVVVEGVEIVEIVGPAAIALKQLKHRCKCCKQLVERLGVSR
jgi:hypothetical protein